MLVFAKKVIHVLNFIDLLLMNRSSFVLLGTASRSSPTYMYTLGLCVAIGCVWDSADETDMN